MGDIQRLGSGPFSPVMVGKVVKHLATYSQRCYLCNGIVKEGSIPEDWKSSVVLPIYKGKGDPMECGSYRGIKLLEHGMKVVERIFEHKIQQQIEINDMQFGFMKGKGTTDAIFMTRQMQENFKVKGKTLYFGFVDSEKAFDGVPREVISWAMRKLGVEEWLVSAVMSMYAGAKTVVRTVFFSAPLELRPYGAIQICLLLLLLLLL